MGKVRFRQQVGETMRMNAGGRSMGKKKNSSSNNNNKTRCTRGWIETPSGNLQSIHLYRPEIFFSGYKEKKQTESWSVCVCVCQRC